MNDEQTLLAYELQVLIDKQTPEASESVDAADASTLEDAVATLEDYFDQPGSGDAVTLLLNGVPLGVVPRHKIDSFGQTAAEPTAAASADVGAGERARLMGVSTRYRLLEFFCPKCSAVTHRIHYDPRDLPVCHNDGVMELRNGSQHGESA